MSPLLYGTNSKYDDTFNAMGEHIESRRRGNRKRGAEFRDVDPDGLVGHQAGVAGGLADIDAYNQLGARDQQQGLAALLERLARGEDSFSAEQLRQGLQQNIAGQRAMAASASPQNTAMAARTAAMQSGRLGSAASGQQALAGIQERQAAQQGLAGLLGNMRQQDIHSALGNRQMALHGHIANEQARTSRFNAVFGQPTTSDRLWTAFGQALPVVGAAVGG